MLSPLSMCLTLSWTGVLVGVLLLGVVAVLVRYKTASYILQLPCLYLHHFVMAAEGRHPVY